MRTVQILVIEDDTDTRSNIVEILRSDGFDVLEAIDGESGVESASLSPYLLLVSDRI